MSTDIQFENITNLTTITTTLTSGSDTPTTESMNDNDLKTILSYAIPLSCLTIILVLLVAFGIRHRHHVLDKWLSLKRMRNTNPKFHDSTGIRRDSEFDLCNHNDRESTTTNQENSSKKQKKYRLPTIF